MNVVQECFEEQHSVSFRFSSTFILRNSFCKTFEKYILFGACVCMRVIIVIYCQASSESATMKSEGHQ